MIENKILKLLIEWLKLQNEYVIIDGDGARLDGSFDLSNLAKYIADGLK